MGSIIGAAFALGLLSFIHALRTPESARESPLVKACWARRRDIGLAVASALGGGVCAWLITRSIPLGFVAGACAAAIPAWRRKAQERAQADAMREAWPDVLDDIVSGLRAGLSISESLVAVAQRGPEAMRPYFATFAEELEATGRLDLALNRFKESLRDSMADRIAEALRVAHRLGGHDVAAMLSTLAHALRAENRARGELLARQSWTVGGARVAAAAPWIVLALLATRPGFVASFATPSGTALLLGGFGASVVAYALMLRLGRLPDSPRVLAGKMP